MPQSFDPPVAGQPEGWSATTVPRSRRPLVVTLGALGVLVMVVATFAPWSTSGEVSRNSYQLAGVARRWALSADSPARVVVDLWPFVGPVLLLPILAALLRWWRVAGVAAAVFGLIAIAFAVTVLVMAPGSGSLRVNPIGPGLLVLGGLVTTVAGVLLWVRPGRHPARAET